MRALRDGAVLLSLAAAAMVLVASCSPAISIVSRPKLEPPADLVELFVVSRVGTEREASPASFERDLLRASQACGVRLGIARISNFDLAPDLYKRSMHEFGAAHVLTVTPTGGQKSRDVITKENYDVSVFVKPANTVLWSAEVSVSRRGGSVEEVGTTLARHLFGRLESDGVVRCAPGGQTARVN